MHITKCRSWSSVGARWVVITDEAHGGIGAEEVGERVADRRHEVLRLIGLEEEAARAGGDRLRDDPGRDIRAGHDDAALGSPREDLVDRRADLAPEPREVDEGDLGVGRPELVQQRGLIDDGPDEEHRKGRDDDRERRDEGSDHPDRIAGCESDPPSGPHHDLRQRDRSDRQRQER